MLQQPLRHGWRSRITSPTSPSSRNGIACFGCRAKDLRGPGPCLYIVPARFLPLATCLISRGAGGLACPEIVRLSSVLTTIRLRSRAGVCTCRAPDITWKPPEEDWKAAAVCYPRHRSGAAGLRHAGGGWGRGGGHHEADQAASAHCHVFRGIGSSGKCPSSRGCLSAEGPAPQRGASDH